MSFTSEFETDLGKLLGIWTLKDPQVAEDFTFFQNLILEHIGAKKESRLKKVGEGWNGYVYWVSNKQVIKLTRDIKDAQASEKIRRKPDKNLIKVYDVFEFGQPYYSTTYGIISEKLTPLSTTDFKSWDLVVQSVQRNTQKVNVPVLRDLTVSWCEDVEAWLASAEGQNVPPQILEALQEHLPTLKQWAQLLTNRGIYWGDLSPSNIMMRGRTPLISDVGFGNISGAPSIERVKLPGDRDE